MAIEITPQVTAQVFKQFTLSLVEVGKAAIVAGITATLTILSTSIYAGQLPTVDQLKTAGMVGLVTMISAIIRYFLNPTQTVIQGQVDPSVSLVPPSTVVTKDEPGK